MENTESSNPSRAFCAGNALSKELLEDRQEFQNTQPTKSKRSGSINAETTEELWSQPSHVKKTAHMGKEISCSP